jgi:hypothetical protein
LEYDLRNLSGFPKEKSMWDIPMFYPMTNKHKAPFREKINDFHFELRELHINNPAEIFNA